MNVRRTCLVIGIACLQSPAVTPASGADEGGALKLSAAQTELLRQEPILVTLRVEGGSAAALPAVVGGVSPERSVRFEVEPAVKLRQGASPLPEEARTESAASRKYDLLEWFEFPEDGTFTVRAVYEGAGARLSSGPVVLTIRTPKAGDADADAVARIHHVPWSNYETNAYCGDTFDVVKRWPDSRLARYCHYWNGRYSQHQKEYAKAIASYESVVAKYPGFALADDARRGIEECRKSLASR